MTCLTIFFWEQNVSHVYVVMINWQLTCQLHIYCRACLMHDAWNRGHNKILLGSDSWGFRYTTKKRKKNTHSLFILMKYNIDKLYQGIYDSLRSNRLVKKVRPSIGKRLFYCFLRNSGIYASAPNWLMIITGPWSNYSDKYVLSDTSFHIDSLSIYLFIY